MMAIRFHRTALVAGPKGQEAVAFAAEISEYVTETLGMPTTWGMQVGGPFATLHWFTDYANMAELEAALLKVTADAGYNDVLAKAKDLFVEGRSEDTIIYMM
jgi:hypothetical protein